MTFLNKATHNYSIQPHGLHYEKAYEGAMYQDGKSYTATGVHTDNHVDLQAVLNWGAKSKVEGHSSKKGPLVKCLPLLQPFVENFILKLNTKNNSIIHTLHNIWLKYKNNT